MYRTWLHVLASLISMATSQRPTIELLPDIKHILDGDVMIGVMGNIYNRGQPLCMDGVELSGLQAVMATMYGMDKVNSDRSLLGDIKLGLNIVEECNRPVASVGKALTLVTQSDVKHLDQLGLKRIDEDEDSRIMIGLIGPVSSASSMPTSNLLSIFDIPMISYAATSDNLGNRELYPNFFRMVPPDKFQTRAMVDLFSFFNWTYVSVLHEEDSYGYNGLTFLRKHCKEAGICIADAFPMSVDFTEEEYEEVVLKVAAIPNANVVAVFAFSEPIRQLVQAAYRLEIKHLIFVLCEAAYASLLDDTGEATKGSFFVDWNIPDNNDFLKFVEDFRFEETANNAVLRKAWEDYPPEQCPGLKTSRNQTIISESCKKTKFGDLSPYWFSSSTYLNTEAVYVYAHALDAFLRDRCPVALRNPEVLKVCYNPQMFMAYLNNVTIETDSGQKTFDEEGSMAVDFRIRQVQEEVYKVGIWRRHTSEIDLLRPLRWRGEGNQVPESVCAKPCLPGEFYIQGELPCCWECHRCRDNEIVSENVTTCEACPVLTWPENGTFTRCLDILPSYITWTNAYGLGLTCIGGMGLLFTLSLVVMVVKQRDRRVIKGANWTMLLVILLGIGLAFTDVILFIAKASDPLCIANRLIFSLSCTLIFTPLLLKTHRVYLVFRASRKLVRVSVLAAASAQYVLTGFAILAQVGLLVTSAILWPITAKLTMPISTEPYVELSCAQDQIGLLIPLSYNLLLLLMCSFIAFLTRKLPDNFNESWYIFLSVTTTLFIWMAFLPTYYAAYFAYHKAALLALALALNGFVTIVCLFLPKVYALKFVNDKDIQITDFSNLSFASPTTKGENTITSVVK